MQHLLISLPAPLAAAIAIAPSRFLMRPQLLTRPVPLPIGRDISPSHVS